MKKYMLMVVCAVGLLIQQAAAENITYTNNMEVEETEQYGFAGIEGGYLNSLDAENKGIVGVRVGMQNSVWRTMFTYESNFESYQAFLIEADRTVVAGLFGGKGRIYLGISGGWIEFYGDKLLDNVMVEFKDYGYAYGGNIGLMFYLSDQIDLDIGYRYLFTNDSCTYDYIDGVNIALHYFF